MSVSNISRNVTGMFSVHRVERNFGNVLFLHRGQDTVCGRAVYQVWRCLAVVRDSKWCRQFTELVILVKTHNVCSSRHALARDIHQPITQRSRIYHASLPWVHTHSHTHARTLSSSSSSSPPSPGACQRHSRFHECLHAVELSPDPDWVAVDHSR